MCLFINCSSCSSQEVTYGSQYGTLCSPTKTNFTFLGWFNESNTIVNSTDTYSINRDQMLTAHWRANNILCWKSYDKCRSDEDSNGSTGCDYGDYSSTCNSSKHRCAGQDYFSNTTTGLYIHYTYKSECSGSGWTKRNNRCEKTFSNTATCPSGTNPV